MHRSLFIAAVAALALAACSSEPEPSPTATLPDVPSATPTASATPEAGPTREATGPCPTRGESMTVARAVAVSSEPVTGETWLAAPVSIAVPAPFAETSDYDVWFEVGARDGATILAGYGFMSGVVLVERAPDGTLTLIDTPLPGGEPRDSWVPDGVDVDADQCYESLALPASLTLADDAVAATGDAMWRVHAEPYGQDVTALADVGGGELLRVDKTYNSALIGESGISLDLPASTFAVTLPFGGWADLTFRPLEDVDGVVPGNWVDYPDYACANDPVFQVRVPDTAEADWAVVGSLRGRDVAAATASNPYAQERYAAYKALKLSWGETPVSFDDFLAAPGLIGLRADGGGWWTALNVDVSPRAWC